MKLGFLGVSHGQLADESIMLIGDPREVPLEEIVRIEDRSLLEGHFKQQTPVYFVSELNSRFLVARPDAATVVYDRTEGVDDRKYTCFSYVKVRPVDLAQKCVDEFDEVEEGIIKLLNPGST